MKLEWSGAFGDVVSYRWKDESVKTVKEFYGLVRRIAEMGELVGITFIGYSDMDTHENEVSFKSVAEMMKGMDKIDAIDADNAYINEKINGDSVSFTVSPVGGSDDGVRVAVMASEKTAKTIIEEIEKK